ncbi:tetratricopeptide repeat protein [Enhygromyxa salina]|uniref:Tetratricopeptide repeat protein n=1 Tax=Enhygromyxa salina TaxID=215803 RepID=A0A2S9XQY6_9BACT|nr:tetratricopeptide repeat protein [Enhygromyxa salina]PRP95101.1 hypothetical protein ENSA7_74150 [Enhygromyxa salina]
MLRTKPQRVLACLALAASLTGVAGCGGSLTRAHDALAVGDEAEAEVQLRKALKSDSTRVEAGMLLAIMLADRGDKIGGDQPKEAEEFYREALSLDAKNEAARIGLARLLMKRGFMDEANELLAMEGCRGCGRLTSMMVHENAATALANGDVLGARALFADAFAQGNDPMDALGVAQTWLVPAHRDLAQAQAALEAAAPLIGRGQLEAERRFQEIRVQLLGAAAAARNNDMVEALFRVRTETLRDEPEFDLRFRISQAQFRNGDSDFAIQRMTSLLENSGQYLEPTQRQVMDAALVVMYSARAAQYLQAGDPVGAVKDVANGLKIDPGNNRLKLQQVLAIAANRLPLAFTELEKASKGKDRNEVEAILYALEVFEQMDANKTNKAYDALEKAERLSPNLPEVVLARAYVLADSRNEDIKKKEDMRDARNEGGVSYPKGRINQYPGALAYIARAKAGVREQGVLHAFRGPGFDPRLTALEGKIREFYPYAVEWHADSGGLIEIISEGEQNSVEYSGPHWLKGTAIASTNSSAEIPVPHIGLVWLEYKGKRVAVVVEDHAHIKVNVGPPAPAPADAADAAADAAAEFDL